MESFKQDCQEIKLNKESYFLDYLTKNKYHLRVFDHKVDIQKVVNTFNTWNQGSKPKVIISVTGGAKNFILPNKVRASFKEGISKIVEKTHALIITGGTHNGVMKLVGEAMKNNYKVQKRSNVKLLGIAYWNLLKDKENLLKSEEKPGYLHEFNEFDNETNLTHLDKNHSHFFLIKDDNPEVKFGGEIELRNNFEKQLKDLKIPTVLIVVNGGHHTIKTILNSMVRNVPVLLICESGGSADLLAAMVNKFNSLSMTEKDAIAFSVGSKSKRESFFNLFIDMIEEVFVSYHLKQISNNNTLEIDNIEEKRHQIRDMYLEIFLNIIQAYHKQIKESKNCQLINMFHFDKGEDLETSLIRTLFNAGKNNSFENLKLILDWNKIDIARNDVFNGDENFTKEELSNLMESAVKRNRPSFVKLLIENKFDLNHFLTLKRLYFLYHFKAVVGQNFKNIPFLQNRKEFHSFDEIKGMIQKLIGTNLPENLFSDDHNMRNILAEFDVKDSPNSRKIVSTNYNRRGLEEFDQLPNSDTKMRVNYPEINFFLWAVLNDRVEIAIVLLSLIKNQLAFCLLGSVILKKFTNVTDKKEKQRFLEASDKFENIAVKLLELFDQEEDDNLNDNLLLTEIDFFGIHLVKLAMIGDCEKFIATETVQRVIFDLWNNAVIFSPDKRLFSDLNMNSFSGISKMCLSYLSLGLFSVFFQHFDWELDSNKIHLSAKEILNQANYKSDAKLNGLKSYNSQFFKHRENSLQKYFCTSPRLYKSKVKYYTKEIETKPNEHWLKIFFIKYQNFICSPKTYFIIETFLFLIFLLIFSYFMVCQFIFTEADSYYSTSNSTEILMPHWTEYAAIFWVFSYVFEIIYQFVFWRVVNYYDLAGCILFIIGMVLRFISLLNIKSCFTAARIIFCINLTIWFIRLINIAMCFKMLGPKLVMIKKMIKEMIYFILIIFIFLLAYAVSTTAMMYPGSSLNGTLLQNLLDISIWNVFGQIVFQPIVDSNNTFSTEAVVYGYFSTIIFMFLANVLLINLLIAMFSNTIDDVQKNANEIWKFQNCSLVLEYDRYSGQFPLPPPVNMISYFIRSIQWMFDKMDRIGVSEANTEFITYELILEKMMGYSESILEKEL